MVLGDGDPQEFEHWRNSTGKPADHSSTDGECIADPAVHQRTYRPSQLF